MTGKLDGQPFTSGTVQQLHKLALGDHTLTVTVETNSGGTYEQSVAFNTVTSTDEISALIERFEGGRAAVGHRRREAPGQDLQGHGVRGQGTRARQEEDRQEA